MKRPSKPPRIRTETAPQRHKVKLPSVKPLRNQQTADNAAKAAPAVQQQSNDERALLFDNKLARISGLAAVSALFRHEPDRVVRLYYEDHLKNAVGAWCAYMAKAHRPYRCVENDELARVAGTLLHGGVVAAALPRSIADISFVDAEGWAKRGEHLFIVDGVGNPHNLGAIARSLAFFGIKHLALSDHPAQAGLSDAAYRVAEGGLEEMTISRIANIADNLSKLRPYYHVVGTSIGKTALALSALPPDRRPLAVLLGNEEHGLPYATQKACETLVTIPAIGAMQSLNVSATAAVLSYELTLFRAIN